MLLMCFYLTIKSLLTLRVLTVALKMNKVSWMDPIFSSERVICGLRPTLQFVAISHETALGEWQNEAAWADLSVTDIMPKEKSWRRNRRSLWRRNLLLTLPNNLDFRIKHLKINLWILKQFLFYQWNMKYRPYIIILD